MVHFEEKLKGIPHKPGVYLFKDSTGRVLYVGKAKDLKRRILQYFGHDDRPQLPYLLEEAEDLDYIVVNSELESLFLENTLIKQYLPPYNIKLRDDKNYAFIKINYASQIPSIGYTRKIENDNKAARYFGPYSSAKKIQQTLDFVRKVFPYCSAEKIGTRPCFYYFLHRCPGVCIGAISLQEYQEQLDRICLFLGGKTSQIKHELKTSMKQAAGRRQFERAAKLRDQLGALTVLDEKQLSIFPMRINWDFISWFADDPHVCMTVLKVREGKLKDKESFIYTTSIIENTAGVLIQKFLESYYADASDTPREIYVKHLPMNMHIIYALLQARSNCKIPVLVPSRGKKAQLVALATTNAQEFLKKWDRSQTISIDASSKTLEELKNILELPAPPRRIEGYDISNTQGTNPVGSMVVIKDGMLAKNEYRKFKITTKHTPDDFAMMEEMLSRRLAHISLQKQEPENQTHWPVPDLLVIDGGKGQLAVAVKVLKEKGLHIPVVGLAKRIEEIFVPGKSKPIVLPHDNPVLQLLQRLRDEAHRFGITFHRQLRGKQATRSVLDEIPGIGPKTKKLLKTKFGTVAQIRQASLEELEATIGKQKAELVKKHI